jgi:hypothetical protein
MMQIKPRSHVLADFCNLLGVEHIYFVSPPDQPIEVFSVQIKHHNEASQSSTEVRQVAKAHLHQIECMAAELRDIRRPLARQLACSFGAGVVCNHWA